jgi:hypothetical protein
LWINSTVFGLVSPVFKFQCSHIILILNDVAILPFTTKNPHISVQAHCGS